MQRRARVVLQCESRVRRRTLVSSCLSLPSVTIGARLELLERAFPKRIEVEAHFRDAVGADLVDAASSRLLIVHEARILEHPKVLRHRGSAHRDAARQLADRKWSPRQLFENGAPGRIAECIKCLTVSLHLRL